MTLLLVEDSFLKFGKFDIGIQVNDFDIANDSIYIATNQGVAFASLNDNLVESSEWVTYNEENGLPSNVIQDISEFNTL